MLLQWLILIIVVFCRLNLRRLYKLFLLYVLINRIDIRRSYRLFLLYVLISRINKLREMLKDLPEQATLFEDILIDLLVKQEKEEA